MIVVVALVVATTFLTLLSIMTTAIVVVVERLLWQILRLRLIIVVIIDVSRDIGWVQKWWIKFVDVLLNLTFLIKKECFHLCDGIRLYYCFHKCDKWVIIRSKTFEDSVDVWDFRNFFSNEAEKIDNVLDFEKKLIQRERSFLCRWQLTTKLFDSCFGVNREVLLQFWPDFTWFVTSDHPHEKTLRHGWKKPWKK